MIEVATAAAIDLRVPPAFSIRCTHTCNCMLFHHALVFFSLQLLLASSAFLYLQSLTSRADLLRTRSLHHGQHCAPSHFPLSIGSCHYLREIVALAIDIRLTLTFVHLLRLYCQLEEMQLALPARA